MKKISFLLPPQLTRGNGLYIATRGFDSSFNNRLTSAGYNIDKEINLDINPSDLRQSLQKISNITIINDDFHDTIHTKREMERWIITDTNMLADKNQHRFGKLRYALSVDQSKYANDTNEKTIWLNDVNEDQTLSVMISYKFKQDNMYDYQSYYCRYMTQSRASSIIDRISNYF